MGKDFFDNVDPNTLVSYWDMTIFDNQFVEPLESGLTDTNLKVQQNAADIEQLKQQIPGGETGKGAYLNLGGTPDRYPTVDECKGEGTDGTGFVVMAKPDGLYFYNPVTKVAIPPKTGGGNLAIHGQFPEIFDATHELNHSGRVTRSGIFYGLYDQIGITEWKDPDKACQIMVTAHVDGYEQHIVIGKEGLAYKLFKPGDNNAPWIHYQGTPGGGGGGILPNDHRFIRLLDVPDSYAGQKGKVPYVNDTEDGLEFKDPPTGGGGGTGPIDFPETFDELLDTPNSYAGHAGRMVVVNGGENGLTFVDRDPNIAETIHNVYERGQRGVDGKSLKGGYVDVSNANNFAQDCARAQLVINSDDTRARVINLAKIAEGNEVALLDTHVREGRITYLYNPTSQTKRVTPAAGDAFWINGAEVTTSQNMPPHSTMVLYPTLRSGVGCWIILLNRAKEDHRPIVNWTDLDDTPADYAGNEGKLLAVKMDNSGIEFVDHLVPSNTEEFTQLRDVPPTFVGSANKLVAVNAAEDALEFIDSPTHIEEFIDLLDSPASYSGSGGKMVTVNSTETALEFTDVPVVPTDVVTEAEAETISQGVMSSGHNLVHMNSFGAPVSQSTNDRPSNIIALNPYIMMSGNTVKTATMSKIVAHTSTTLAADEVRAGRVTFIINQSATHNKNVDVPSGHNFFIDGATTTTRQIVPPLSCKIFFPGIWGNGNKNWAYIGGFSTVPGNVRESALLDGSNRYSAKGLVRSSWSTSTATFTQANVVDSPILAPIGTGNQTINMPQLVEKDTAAPTGSQMRCGQRVTIFNHSAAEKTLVWHSGQGIIINGAKSTADYKIQPRFVEEFVGFKSGTEYIWICVSSKKADGLAGSGSMSATDQEFLTGIQTGDKYLHANAMVTPASVIASTTFTAEQAATTNNLLIRPTTGSTTGTMPLIASVTTTGLPAGTVRLGFEMTISNHGANAVTINYQNGAQYWNNGSFGSSTTLAANKWIKLVAINTSGSTYGWAKVASGDH